MFYLLITLFWLIIAFFTNTFVNAILFVILSIGTYFVCKGKIKDFPKVYLFPAKLTLTFSFWGCSALCLYEYQKSISCLTCMQGYLGRALNTIFGNGFNSIIKSYERFEVMFILACLWGALFVFSIVKRGKDDTVF